MKKQSISTALAVTVLLCSGAAMAETADGWTVVLAPYVWLPDVNGELSYDLPPGGDGSPNVGVDASDLLDALDAAAMVMGVARKDRWMIGTDFIYLALSGDKSSVSSVDFNPGSGPVNLATASLNAGVHTDLDGVVWSLTGGYAVIQEPHGHLDLFGGFRYFNLDTKTSWNLTADVTGLGEAGETLTFARSGSIQQDEDIWSGIVGAQGRTKLADSNWFVHGYVDVGSGSSAFTWQGFGGVGYGFDWGDVALDYRYLYYSQDDGKFINELSFGGPALGAAFRF